MHDNLYMATAAQSLSQGLGRTAAQGRTPRRLHMVYGDVDAIYVYLQVVVLYYQKRFCTLGSLGMYIADDTSLPGVIATVVQALSLVCTLYLQYDVVPFDFAVLRPSCLADILFPGCYAAPFLVPHIISCAGFPC
jgi:hypothetical protein